MPGSKVRNKSWFSRICHRRPTPQLRLAVCSRLRSCCERQTCSSDEVNRGYIENFGKGTIIPGIWWRSRIYTCSCSQKNFPFVKENKKNEWWYFCLPWNGDPSSLSQFNAKNQIIYVALHVSVLWAHLQRVTNILSNCKNVPERLKHVRPYK